MSRSTRGKIGTFELPFTQGFSEEVPDPQNRQIIELVTLG